MTLRGDIREYFTQEAAAIPPPAGLRASVTAEALRDIRVERRGMRFAAVVAAALAVAIVAGLLAASAIRHINAPVPGVKPGQHGIVLDADAVDASHGWALLGQCTITDATLTTTCPYWVEATHDGGRSWVDPVKIASYLITDGDAPRHIHFVDSRNGFVYGNAVAYVTHDGGRTWRPTLTMATEVVAIDGRGPVWAVIYPCGKGTQCSYEVFVSRDLGKSWSQTSALPSNFSPRHTVPFGANGLILTSFGTGDMAVSSDGAHTWVVISGQCPATATENDVASPDGKEIWQYCGRLPASQSPSAGGDFLAVSEDGGRTWTRRPGPQVPTNGAILVSPARGVAFMLPIGALLMTGDSGQTWQAVAGSGEFASISFAGPIVWAVDNQFTVWGSTDGGYTWAKLPAQP